MLSLTQNTNENPDVVTSILRQEGVPQEPETKTLIAENGCKVNFIGEDPDKVVEAYKIWRGDFTQALQEHEVCEGETPIIDKVRILQEDMVERLIESIKSFGVQIDKQEALLRLPYYLPTSAKEDIEKALFIREGGLRTTNGFTLRDLMRPVVFVDNSEDSEQIDKKLLRILHTAAHELAHALTKKETSYTIGENGIRELEPEDIVNQFIEEGFVNYLASEAVRDLLPNTYRKVMEKEGADTSGLEHYIGKVRTNGLSRGATELPHPSIQPQVVAESVLTDVLTNLKLEESNQFKTLVARALFIRDFESAIKIGELLSRDNRYKLLLLNYDKGSIITIAEVINSTGERFWLTA